MSEEIKELSDVQHARLRTPMYLGSTTPNTQHVVIFEDNKPIIKEMTWVPARFTAFREVFDNSLDEVIGHGHGNRIDVTYDESTGEFSVADNGRGIPLDKVQLVFSKARAGRNFGERQNVVGTNGVGGSVVNFCSKYFNVTVKREKQELTQNFSTENNELVIHEPTTTKATGNGTKITFKLCDEVFKHQGLPEEFIESRVYEVALINPKVNFYYNGKKIKAKPIGSTLPSPMHLHVNDDSIDMEFYVQPNYNCDDEFSHSIVNNIPAFNGGVHIEAFKRAFASGIIKALEKESKRRKLKPTRSDIKENLFILNVTKMNAPDFDSQSKSRLINVEAGKAVTKLLTDDLFTKLVSTNKDWVNEIFERCAERTHKKDMADLDSTAKKISKSKIASLRDATGKDRSKCILYITEGLSAVSGLCEVRDSTIHGGLPLTGKILNVHDRTAKQVADNKCLKEIMSSLGLMIGKPATNLRYGKVFLASDADPDGANISALLVNFFYKFWPDMFDPENPMVYKWKSPLVILTKGKKRHYIYEDDYHEFNPSEWAGWNIIRAKGLARLTSDDWKECVTNPRIEPIVSDENGELKSTLDLIFNTKRSKDRQQWLGMSNEETTEQELTNNSAEYINDTSHEYAIYVAENRAIPMLTDGLKASQRIAMWLLKDQNKPIKTAGFVGKMMGSNLYVHGDNSAEQMASRLAAPYVNNNTLIKGHGAFGSRTAPVSGIGAGRYTEIEKDKFADKYLYNDIDICPMKENYDGSKKMPVTFLPIIPLVLLNGISGIAVGFACSILPRKLSDLQKAVKDVLTKGYTNRELLPYFEKYDCDIIRDKINPNKYIIKGKVKQINTSTVHITEIPYGKSLDDVIARLIELEDNGLIVDYKDNSTKNILIEVKMKRADLEKHDEDSLISLFKLIQRETENITVLDPTGKFIINYDSPQELVKDFVKWRLSYYVDRYEHLLDKEEEEALFYMSYIACFEGKNPLANRIGKVKSKDGLKQDIIKAIEDLSIEVDTSIVDKICSLPVYRFTEEGKNHALDKIKEANAKIDEYTMILDDDNKRKEIFAKEAME